MSFDPQIERQQPRVSYILTAFNEESGEDIASIQSYSLDGIEEQYHKIEVKVQEFQNEL